MENSKQSAPRPSWLDGGAEAVAMAAEDGLLPEAQHTPRRIDSTAFRRGVRAAKTGVANPYNGPALRDEWEAGRAYAKARKANAAIAKATGSSQ